MSEQIGQRSSRAPRVMIAAVRSSSGKTSIATGLMGALAGRGYRVQGFKVGPDFIDPSFHTAVTGRWSRNLDTWMLSCGQVREYFQRAAADADLAVIEGVMGLFDGLRGQGEQASSAQVAKLLGCPVVLVLDVRSQARSAVVEFLGCRSFDPDLRLAGVILNRYSGERHLEMLQAAFHEAGIPVLGAVREGSLPRLAERHLGLVPVPEQHESDPLLQGLAQEVARQLDLEAILAAAGAAPEPSRTYHGRQRLLSIRKVTRTGAGTSLGLAAEEAGRRDQGRGEPGQREPVKVALAWDAAFNFYYRDGLDLLSSHGIELVPFSPLRDRSLPAGIAGVLLPGGFPELFARELAGNEGMKDSLRRAHSAGLPIYAECGGFMYLCEALGDLEGNDHPMVGLVPGRCRMAGRLVGMGYVTAEAREPNILCREGEVLRGHEFHYSSFIPSKEPFPWAFTFRKGDGRTGSDGYANGSLLASYFHFHFAANPRAAARYAERCRNWSYQQQDRIL
jgi:cobyrinic acid a,c-diamide synthase